MLNNFPCTSCGACCKSINGVKELESFSQNGICIYLTDDNTCEIYKNRPMICRVDEYYKRFLYKHMSKAKYYNENIKVCNALQNKLNLDKKYKINLIKEI
ncbi:YkgJ family cysteine cluster protein [Campylobacter sp. RM12640]|uniref:YkgJ family cysteine cluster protein n=1 Tax=unclassified Campylobacter TaxID=2593542 RepID=UPI0030143985|nr:YkgJ family cysteine cluster protein [Campylobacter sp. RM12640]MBZ7989616.1 YkgJ family cysteine cluster protein [Campylobacter sp. RM12635]